MRRRTIVEDVYCDLCSAKGEVEAAGAFVILLAAGTNVGRSQPRLIDTCAEHKAQLDQLYNIVRLLPVMEPPKPAPKAGVEEKPKPEPKPKATAKSRAKPEFGPCPLCGEEMRRASIVDHMIGGAHRLKHIDQPVRCPDCKKNIASTHGMLVHRSRKHGYSLHADYVERAAKRPT